MLQSSAFAPSYTCQCPERITNYSFIMFYIQYMLYTRHYKLFT